MTSIAQILIDKWEGNTAPEPVKAKPVEKAKPVVDQDTLTLRENIRGKLQQGVWVVNFTKTDGSQSLMEVTLDPAYMPEQKEGTAVRAEPDHLLQVYSPDRQGWRSFVVKNVNSIYQKV